MNANLPGLDARDDGDLTSRPEGYPGRRAPATGLLHQGRFTSMRPVDLSEVPGVSRRTAVVAVGSNASPAVLGRKLARSGVHDAVPFVAGTVTGLGVGHSAHVSVPGYVAAAPYRAAGTSVAVYATLLDDEQVRCVDETEPQYVRRRVDDPACALVLAGAPARSVFWLYDSRWGVLAPPDADPLALCDQHTLHARLRRDWPEYTEVFAATGTRADPAAAVRALAADAGLRTRVRERLRASGWARPSGLEDYPGVRTP